MGNGIKFISVGVMSFMYIKCSLSVVMDRCDYDGIGFDIIIVNQDLKLYCDNARTNCVKLVPFLQFLTLLLIKNVILLIHN